MDGVGRVTVSLRKSTTGALIVVVQTGSDFEVWNQNGGGGGVAHPLLILRNLLYPQQGKNAKNTQNASLRVRRVHGPEHFHSSIENATIYAEAFATWLRICFNFLAPNEFLRHP